MAKPKGKMPNMMPKPKFGPQKAAPVAKSKPGKYDGDSKMGKYC